jgi:hypothetical protein
MSQKSHRSCLSAKLEGLAIGALLLPSALAQRVTSEDLGWDGEGYDYGGDGISISGLLTLALLLVGFVVSKSLRMLFLGYIAFLAAFVAFFWFLKSLNVDKWLLGVIALALIFSYPKIERYLTGEDKKDER